MFGAYFGSWQDIWFLEVASSLPKVLTAKGKFPCLKHIFAFGRIFGFWILLAAFQKYLHQRANSHFWSIFWALAGYLVFRGCSQTSKSTYSKMQILMFGAYFGLWQDIWCLEIASSLPNMRIYSLL